MTHNTLGASLSHDNHTPCKPYCLIRGYEGEKSKEAGRAVPGINDTLINLKLGAEEARRTYAVFRGVCRNIC